MSFITVIIAKGDLICNPFGVRGIVRPGAIGGQKVFIKFVILQSTCLTDHRPVGRLKYNATACLRRAIAAVPVSLQASALWQGVAAFGQMSKGSLDLVVSVFAYQHLVVIT